MTEDQFMKAVMESDVADRLLLDPDETRFQIGRTIGILKYHIPPDISYQEHCPLIPDPVVKALWDKVLKHRNLKIVVWRLTNEIVGDRSRRRSQD